jgi:hypothetical protein
MSPQAQRPLDEPPEQFATCSVPRPGGARACQQIAFSGWRPRFEHAPQAQAEPSELRRQRTLAAYGPRLRRGIGCPGPAPVSRGELGRPCCHLERPATDGAARRDVLWFSVKVMMA